MEEAARRGEMGTVYKSIRSLKSWVGIRHAM